MENLQKINRFYVFMAIVMVALSALVIISLRSVFSAISLASQVDESLLSSEVPRVNTGIIDDALNSVKEREFTPLDL